MIAETICVGTEILLGNIINTNAAYLAEQYARLGISSYYQSVVGDNEERIRECLKIALSRSDLVVLSGGLGPTQDDITKDTVAEFLGREMELNEAAALKIREYFAARGKRMSTNNLRQAMVLKGALVLENGNGLSPGVLVEMTKNEIASFGKKGAKKQLIIMLPGPLEELVNVWEQQAVPYLQKLSGQVILSSIVKICDRPESEVAELLDDLIRKSGDGVTVAPYAKTGEVHVRVTAGAEDEKAAKKLLKPVVKEIKSRLGDSVYTTHEETTLEQAVADLLMANNLTVTTAESCTGGLIAARLVNVPGVSEIFKFGCVTYSNKAKRKIIGVKRKTLDRYGAVSEQVVYEMAEGAAGLTKADVAVAVSGIAGPDGGTEEKPVGLVYIGVNVRGTISVKEYRFKGNRMKIRNAAAASALIQLRHCILEYYSRVTFGDKENG